MGDRCPNEGYYVANKAVIDEKAEALCERDLHEL